MKPLFNANIEVLKQLKELIDCCLQVYVREEQSQHAGIGEHVRHVMDHYRAFAVGVPVAKIDYNLRSRNSPEETNPSAAHDQIDSMIQFLMRSDMENTQVTVISEISLRECQSEQLHSNIERELLYLINHSIHHMAYASLLASTRGVCVPRHIGLAPGTATYERTQQKQEEQHA